MDVDIRVKEDFMGDIVNRLLEEEFCSRFKKITDANNERDEAERALRQKAESVKWATANLADFLHETGPFKINGLTYELQKFSCGRCGIQVTSPNGDLKVLPLPEGWTL